jgi:TfoX/Sxy family transcriptional regulator of competence genes
MVYSASLALRMRQSFSQQSGIVEKKMFGGVCFLLHGNMLVGVWKNSLIARIGLAQEQTALCLPHVRKMDITGKPMKGWVLVEPEGLETDTAIQEWIERALQFVATLPRK